MRPHWLILTAALGLAACQPREPSAPQAPGAETAEAPPAATTAVPPPTVQPAPTAAACPPQPQASCPPPRRAAAAPARRQAGARPPARVQRAERRYAQVDVPPDGGYRYEELQDREIVRRYDERRYEGQRWREDRDEPRREDHAWRERRYEPDGHGRGYREDDGYHDERRHHGDGYREERDDRGWRERDEGGYAWRGREGYGYERREDRYSGGPPPLRHDEGYAGERRYGPPLPRDHEVERRYGHGGHDAKGLAHRRGGHVTEVIRERGGHHGVRRYEERSYASSSRSTERYSETRSVVGGGCCTGGHVPPAAGRDAHGFLTWPGKVPAVP